jgi:hypothetical protein
VGTIVVPHLVPPSTIVDHNREGRDIRDTEPDSRIAHAIRQSCQVRVVFMAGRRRTNDERAIARLRGIEQGTQIDEGLVFIDALHTVDLGNIIGAELDLAAIRNDPVALKQFRSTPPAWPWLDLPFSFSADLFFPAAAAPARQRPEPLTRRGRIAPPVRTPPPFGTSCVRPWTNGRRCPVSVSRL